MGVVKVVKGCGGTLRFKDVEYRRGDGLALNHGFRRCSLTLTILL
ncbi:MAG: hypothetical protein QXQ92_05460 [Candidatus Nezhaarchaeales archaeon]